MEKFNAGILLKLHDLSRTMAEECAKHKGAAVEDDLSSKFAAHLAELASDLHLKVAVRLVDHVRDAGDYDTLSAATTQFRNAMTAELQSQAFLVIRPDLVGLFDLLEPFGPEVGAKFPKAAEDLQEAAKCLALERATASVFHLMRAMEGVVGALCGKLNIPNPDREWGKLLSDLHKAIEAMPKGDTRNAWSEAHANLYHVKQAWRNETMHPKQTYTTEQAEDVFRAMRTFMSHLAGLV